ncbi:MAG: hypothetical protein QM747_05745 [Nocardioides sp.]
MPMETEIWHVRIAVSATGDAVYADALLTDGPALVAGSGRCPLTSAAGDADRARAAAVRRALGDLTQAMRHALEYRPALADQLSDAADEKAS